MRDMSRKFLEADVKRKFDMKSIYHLSSSREKKLAGVPITIGHKQWFK